MQAGPRMCAGRPENVCRPARECVQAGTTLQNFGQPKPAQEVTKCTSLSIQNEVVFHSDQKLNFGDFSCIFCPARGCVQAGPRMCTGRPENVCRPARGCVQAGPRMCRGRPEDVYRPARECEQAGPRMYRSQPEKEHKPARAGTETGPDEFSAERE